MKKQHKILFILSSILAITSLRIAIFYWGKLPDIIPTHFGISGQPDDWNQKSLFYVFLLPGLQILLQAMFVFLYYKPQYSDMPTTMWLMTLEKKHRDHAFDLIRKMLIGTSLWIGVLFTYMTYMMNISALNNNTGMSPLVLGLIVGGMLAWLAYWTIKVYKATRSAMKNLKASK